MTKGKETLKKKNSSKKSTVKNNSSKAKGAKKDKLFDFNGIILITLGVLIFLALLSVMFSDPTSLAGSMGVFINRIFIGLLGIGAYVLPFVLIYMGVSYIKIDKQEQQLKKEQEERKKRNKILKYIGVGVTLACVAFFLIANLHSIISQNRAEQLLREEQAKAEQLLEEEQNSFKKLIKDNNINIEQLIKEGKYEQAFDDIIKTIPIGTSIFPDGEELIIKMQQQYYSRLDTEEVLQIDGVTIYADKYSIFSIDENNHKTVYFSIPEGNVGWLYSASSRKSVMYNDIIYTNGFILFRSDIIGNPAVYVISFDQPSEKYIRFEYEYTNGEGSFVDSFTKLEDGNILLGFTKSKTSVEDTLILFVPNIEEKFIYLTKEEFENIYDTEIPSSIGLVSFADIIDSVDYVYTTKRDR